MVWQNLTASGSVTIIVLNRDLLDAPSFVADGVVTLSFARMRNGAAEGDQLSNFGAEIILDDKVRNIRDRLCSRLASIQRWWDIGRCLNVAVHSPPHALTQICRNGSVLAGD